MKRFKNRREKPQVESRINVTSLVDVMLVLLIIFILIAPLIEHGIKISLPKSAPSKIDKPDLVIKVTEKQVFLDDNAVDLSQLKSLLLKARENSPDISVSIKADRKIAYQKVISVLDIVRESGISNVALATESKARK